MPHPEMPALALVQELPDDPQKAEETRARAADLLEDFVAGETLSALDAVLAADAEGWRYSPALAREVSETSRMVDTEVTRFLNLSSKPR